MRWHVGRAVITLAAACLALRLLAACALQSWNQGSGRLYGFRDGEIAASLAAGNGFAWPADSSYCPGTTHPTPTAWQAPVYPLILGATFRAFGIYSPAAFVAAIILQSLTGAVGCVLLFSIGRRIWGGATGLLAGLLFAISPSAIYFAIQKVSSITLVVVLLLALVLLLLRLAVTPSLTKGVVCGFVMGVVLLTEPTIGAFCPFAALWFLLTAPTRWRTRLTIIALMAVTACLIILPWQIRNYMLFHRVFLIKSNLTRELFLSNYAEGAEDWEREKRLVVAAHDGERSALYRSRFLESIAQRPARFAQKTLRRMTKFWISSPGEGDRKHPPNAMDLVVGVAYFAILATGLAGLILTRLRGKEVRLLVLALFSLPLPYYITWFTRFRYRFPVEPVLMLFAAYALSELFSVLRQTTGRALPGE